jgi:hypothetical protein
MIRDLKV